MTWTSSPLPANCCTSLYKRTCTCEDWPYTIGIGQSLSGLAKARGTSILFKYKQWENSIRGKFQLPTRPLQTRLAYITTIVRTRRFRHQAAKRYACATSSWITSLSEDTAASINGCSGLSKRSPPLKDRTSGPFMSLSSTLLLFKGTRLASSSALQCSRTGDSALSEQAGWKFGLNHVSQYGTKREMIPGLQSWNNRKSMDDFTIGKSRLLQNFHQTKATRAMKTGDTTSIMAVRRK